MAIYTVCCCYCGVFIEKYVHTVVVVCIQWLLCELHGHICPYRNVLPEAVYCCFTRIIPFCLHVFIIRLIGCYHVTKFRYSTLSGFFIVLQELYQTVYMFL